jgi:hypothetical protein
LVLDCAAVVTIRIFPYPTALAIAALALGLSASGALAFSASFNWCKGSSPRFELKDVPTSTAKLQFTMTDLNFPGFRHGGGTVAFDERRRIHDLLMEGVELALKKRGYPALADTKAKSQRKER